TGAKKEDLERVPPARRADHRQVQAADGAHERVLLTDEPLDVHEGIAHARRRLELEAIGRLLHPHAQDAEQALALALEETARLLDRFQVGRTLDRVDARPFAAAEVEPQAGPLAAERPARRRAGAQLQGV